MAGAASFILLAGSTPWYFVSSDAFLQAELRTEKHVYRNECTSCGRSCRVPHLLNGRIQWPASGSSCFGLSIVLYMISFLSPSTEYGGGSYNDIPCFPGVDNIRGRAWCFGIIRSKDVLNSRERVRTGKSETSKIRLLSQESPFRSCC